MKNKEIQSEYLKSKSEEQTIEGVYTDDDMVEGHTSSSDIGTIMDSIDEDYVGEFDTTGDEGTKQYGLSKPKKTIINAKLQND